MKKSIPYILVGILIVGATQCSTVTIRTNAQSETDPSYPNGGTVHRAFWGYFPLGGDYIVRECSSKSLESVDIHTNWWEAIVTALTAGIYCPVEVNYLCAKQAQPARDSIFSESAPITPIYSGADTLVTIWVSYIHQTRTGWEWQAWLTDSKGAARPAITVSAEQDTLCYLVADTDNQIDFSIEFVNQADTSLRVYRLSQ